MGQAAMLSVSGYEGLELELLVPPVEPVVADARPEPVVAEARPEPVVAEARPDPP
jgi:hypothetical protein